MREIKFRAWDGKQMCIKEMQTYFAGYGLMFDHFEHPVALMQYTGLKDKNGKEIYEGDILDKKWKWEVIYFADGFIGKHETPNNSMPLHTLIQHRERAGCSIEIIGNVYENPELLEGL